MRKNIGGLDRIIRTILGLSLIFSGIYFQNKITKYFLKSLSSHEIITNQTVLITTVVLGFLFLFSGILGFSLLYRIFGISSNKTIPQLSQKDQKKQRIKDLEAQSKIEEEKRKQNLKKQQEQLNQKTQQLQTQLVEAEEKYKKKEQNLNKELPSLDERVQETPESLAQRFTKGISKTKNLLVNGFLNSINSGEITEDTLEDIEGALLTSDLGFVTTNKIIETLRTKVQNREITTKQELVEAVKKIIFQVMDRDKQQISLQTEGPTVIMFVGVNGVGKTTTIGKLAAQYKNEGKKVLVAAGDTFRAAAIEQVGEWCSRAGVDLVAKEINSDPAATIYEAATKAKEENYDILLCDTSGRLHTNANLMEELSKIQRVVKKVIPTAPHISILVLDATTGQNAITQTKEFSNLIGLDGLVVTKLDGTAKGGVIIAIVNEFDIPVYMIGVGEQVNDLQNFSPKLFVDSLFEGSSV